MTQATLRDAAVVGEILRSAQDDTLLVLRSAKPSHQCFIGCEMILRVVLLATCLSIFPITGKAADNLGILGARPRWSVLEHYQETITHDEFAHFIYDVYCTHGFAPDLIEVNTDAARILTNRESQISFTLRFAKERYLAQSGAAALASREILATCESGTSRSRACELRSTRGIWVANGPRWKSAGFKSTALSQCRKVI